MKKTNRLPAFLTVELTWKKQDLFLTEWQEKVYILKNFWCYTFITQVLQRGTNDHEEHCSLSCLYCYSLLCSPLLITNVSGPQEINWSIEKENRDIITWNLFLFTPPFPITTQTAQSFYTPGFSNTRQGWQTAPSFQKWSPRMLPGLMIFSITNQSDDGLCRTEETLSSAVPPFC